MTITINISLPKEMHRKAKNLVSEGKYASISEVVRAGLRRVTTEANQVTENGFPNWFEDKVLEAEQQPMSRDLVWETEEDITNYFKKIKAKVKKVSQGKHDKNPEGWSVQSIAR